MRAVTSCACTVCLWHQAVLARVGRGSSPGDPEVGLITSRKEASFAQSKLVPFMPNHIETFDVRMGQYCLRLQGRLGVYLGGGGQGVKKQL